MESRLDEERARIRKIAEPVLELSRKLKRPDPEGDILAQAVSIQAAGAAYQNAKLSREICEIAVKEYEEGIYPQDLATAEGAIRLAESDGKRTMDEIVEAMLCSRKSRRSRPGRCTIPWPSFNLRLV